MLQRCHFEVLTLAVLSTSYRALALLFREQILEPCNFVFHMVGPCHRLGHGVVACVSEGLAILGILCMTASDGLPQLRDIFLRVIHFDLLLKLQVDHFLDFLLCILLDGNVVVLMNADV